MKLLPFVRLYLAADAGGGTGAPAAVASPAAAPAGGDGAGPSAADVLTELQQFEAPNPNDALTPEKKPEENKPEEKPEKPEQKKPEQKPGKPGEKPPTEPPAKQLREELDRVKKELEETRAKVTDHPKVKELEGSIGELQKERDALKGEVERFRKELDIRDPMANSKLREHQEAFDKDFARTIEVLPELEGQYAQLVGEFARLPRTNREEYRTKLGEFETRLEELVGARKAATALDFIRKGNDYVQERQRLTTELTGDASRLAFEGREARWREHDGEVSTALSKALTVPEDIETADPFAPVSYVNKALGVMKEEQRAKLTKTVDEFTRKVFAGAKPRSPKDFPGLTPEQIQEKLAGEEKWHSEARPLAVGMMKQGMLALALMRPLIAEVSRLRERVEKESAATPPDPTNPQGGKDGADEDDLANYRAPEIRI